MVFWEVYSLVLEVIKESVVEIMRRYRQAALRSSGRSSKLIFKFKKTEPYG